MCNTPERQDGDDAVIQLDAYRPTTPAERFTIKCLFGTPVDPANPSGTAWTDGTVDGVLAAVAEADAALATTTTRLSELQRRHYDFILARYGRTPAARRKVPGRAKLNGTTTRKENRNAK